MKSVNYRKLREKFEKLKKLEEKIGDRRWSDNYVSAFEDELTEEETLDFLEEIQGDLKEAHSIAEDGEEEEKYFGERTYINLNDF